jgi:glutamate N-acetyltransferase/amino-acid N-acetyltransferase
MTTSPRVAGVRLASTAAGVRYRNRRDLVLMELAAGTACAATFTRNAFCAAPVTVAKAHLAAMGPRYLLINSGNANAGTGARGIADAEVCCQAVAEQAGCPTRAVLPFSTGVIGEDLPVDRITAAIPGLFDTLAADGWEDAARAIMTTDTVPKLARREVEIDGRTATLVGMAKGAGMIRPDMATMLAFLATDTTIAPALLHTLLCRAVDSSFNAITIDGDTSTNDACVLAATGALDNPALTDEKDGRSRTFGAALTGLCQELASAIVRDGEGATRLVTIDVTAAATTAEARQVADAIAHSPLVKTAVFAGDPNWGRILAAVGRAGVADLDIDDVQIWLDDVRIVSGGGRDPAYREAAGQRVMSQDSLTIRVSLGRGEAATRVLTCDLSYDYVRINAEYRT